MVENVPAADPATRYPVRLVGYRACRRRIKVGNAKRQKVLKKSQHPEYPDMKQWMGRRCDPEAFDLERKRRMGLYFVASQTFAHHRATYPYGSMEEDATNL